MKRNDHALPVAVIGAGFSGTMASVQLIAHLPADRSVLLCERGEQFGRGRAYNKINPDHLLNVRAANMSAYPDRPGHFEAWLANRDDTIKPCIDITPAGTFASRELYGRYLAEILTDAVSGSDVPRLQLVNDAIVDIWPDGEHLTLRSEGGRVYPAAAVILAMGNLTGSPKPASRYWSDPWRTSAYGRLHAHLPVLIVGTGLTMIDAVATLRRHGFEGRIVALSRRGLLPARHEATAPWPTPTFSTAEAGSLSLLLSRLRNEVAMAHAAGLGWRSVIDALRPITDTLWRGFSAADRSRFLRHLRPYWDVHRHRAAPSAGVKIADEIAAGNLVVRAGRITTISDGPNHARVTYRPRGTLGHETLDVQCILDARGVGSVGETDDPLLSRLIGRGLVRPGPFGIGLHAEADFSVPIPGRNGGARFWTLGPLLRGVLWECSAVPDIRNQAAELATVVADSLALDSLAFMRAR